MIGKTVPTKDGRFRVEVSTTELENIQPVTTTDFFAEWIKQVVPEETRKLTLEEIPLIVYETCNEDIPIKVWEAAVTSATVKLDDITYDIPLDMAVSALQNIEEEVEISYTKGKKDE